jgi:hypothetical protein
MKMPVEIDDQNFAGPLESQVESYRPGKSPEELSKRLWITPSALPNSRSW